MIAALVLFWFLFVGLKRPVTDNQIQQWQVEAMAGAKTDALRSIQDAADRGQVIAKRALGQIYLQQGNNASALKWLTQAATSGDRASAAILGKAYFLGTGGFQKNYTAAHEWFMLSAAQNDPNAAYYLGLMYKSGYGVSKNAEMAVHWFTLAANQQLPSGLFMLANAYRDGEGVTINEKKAVELYQSAADLDLPEAVQALMMAAHHGELGLKYDSEQDKHAFFEMSHALKEHPAAP